MVSQSGVAHSGFSRASWTQRGEGNDLQEREDNDLPGGQDNDLQRAEGNDLVKSEHGPCNEGVEYVGWCVGPLCLDPRVIVHGIGDFAPNKTTIVLVQYSNVPNLVSG